MKHPSESSLENLHRGKSDALTVLTAQVGALLIGVVSQSLLAWSLGPAGRGSFAVCSVLGTLMPMLFGLAFDRAVQVRLAAGQISLRSAIRVSAFVSLVAGLGSALVTLGLLATITPLRTKSDPVSFAFAVTMMPLTLGFTFQLRLHTALRRFGDYLATTMALGLSNVLLIMACAWGFGLGVTGALLALLISYGVGSSLGFFKLIQISALERPNDRKIDWTGLLSYGVRSYPATVGHTIDLNVGTMMLGVLGTQSEIGLFAAVSALMQRFLIVPQSLQEALLPRVAADPVGRPELVASAARIAFSVTVVAALALLLMRRPVIALLLSRDFFAALPMLWWLAGGIGIHASSALLMPYFDGTGRPQVVSASIWVGLLTNVASILLLYPFAGMEAAAVGFFLSFAARFLVLYCMFWRTTRTPLHRVLIPNVHDMAMLRLAFLSSIGRPGRETG